MSRRKISDQRFIEDIFRELDSNSKYHKYAPLNEYQGTEGTDIIRPLSDAQTGLVLCYRNEPEQIASPFIMEVIPRVGIPQEFFTELPAASLAEIVLKYATKGAEDSILKAALKRRTKMLSDLEGQGSLNGITVLCEKGSENNFAAELSEELYVVTTTTVETEYSKELHRKFYDRLVKSFNSRKNKTATKDALAEYKKEHGSSSLSSDVEKLKEILSSHDYSSSRDDRMKKLETLLEDGREALEDLEVQWGYEGWTDDLDDEDKGKYALANASFKETITDEVGDWFKFTSLEITESLKHAISEFDIGDQWLTSSSMLESFEKIITEYSKKDLNGSYNPEKAVSVLNKKYIGKIFSKSNVEKDVETLLKIVAPAVTTAVGKKGLIELRSITSKELYKEMFDCLDLDPNALIDESAIAETYATSIAGLAARNLTKRRLRDILPDDESKLSDAFTYFKAVKTDALNNPLFSTVRDMIFGERYSFLISSTLDASFNTGKVWDEETGEREGPRKHTVLRLSDAMSAVPPSIEESVDITFKLCDYVNHLHRRGIDHNGIDPRNVLLSEDIYELMIAGYNPERRPADSCYSLENSGRNDLFGIASTLYTLIEGHVPFRATTPEDMHEDVRSRWFAKRAKKMPEKLLLLLEEVFSDALRGSSYSVAEFKKRLAKVTKVFPSQSYYSFANYIDRVGVIHKEQLEERLESRAV